MKKLAIGAAGVGVLAVAGALATSYYVGGRIQEVFVQTTDSWMEGSGVTVEVLEYERGIIGSKVTTQWTIATEDDAYEFTALHDILHGPWPMGKAGKMVTSFQWPEETSPALMKALGQRAPLEWTAVADWSGATSNNMVSPSFQAKFEDESSLTWGGLQSEWTLSAQQDASKGFARMPTLLVEEQDGSRLEVAGIDLTFDARVPDGYTFWVGSSAMQLERFVAHDAAEDFTVGMNNLDLKSSNELEKELLQSSMSLQAKQLDGPNLSAQNLMLQVQANNIKAAWFEQWMAMARAGDGSADQVNQMAQSLPQLLAGKPELQVQRLSMDSSQGPVALSAYLRYVGENPEAENFDPAMDVEGQFQAALPVNLLKFLMKERVRRDYQELLEGLGSDIGEEELNTAVEEGVQERLDKLVDSGVLKQSDDKLSATLSFAKGEFKLNEQPKSLQQLIGIGMGL